MTVADTISPLLGAARNWHDAGYCVIPSHEDGGKRPFGAWKKYQHVRPTWTELEGWLNSGRYTGIGVITGAVSGNAEMMEIEGPQDALAIRLNKVTAQAEKYDSIGLGDLWAAAIHGCSELSAGGGLHVFIRVSDGPALGNTKLAMAGGKVLAETRGEGGFVIVAPTPGRKGHTPDSVYVLIPDADPANTVSVTSEERDMLHLAFALALDEAADEPEPLPPPAPAPAPIRESGLTPWDDWAAHTTWADILAPHGWQQLHTAEDGRTHWTRPGKNKDEGSSATTIEDGPLYVFTTSTSFPAGVGMSKQYAHARLNHDGDQAAAVRHMREAGYGDPLNLHDVLPPWTPTPMPRFDDTTPIHDIDDESDAATIRRDYVHAHLPAVNWHELWADTSEEEWIVEPLLPARRLIALYSAPKVGKSLLMLELAAGIAAGRSLLGQKAGPPRIVLYVDFENDPKADIRERLSDMGYGPDDLERLKLLSFPTLGALDSEKGAIELMAAVEVYGAELVVIDTVSRSVAGDENENDTWLAFYRHTGLKLKQAQVALIRLDHAGKDEAKGQRGGSAKSGDVDAVWRMSRIDDDLYELSCEANRFPIDPESRQLVLERRSDDVLVHVVKGDKVAAKRAALAEAIAACGPYPEGKRNWKSVRETVLKHRQIKASSKAWSAAVSSYFVVPEWRDHDPRSGTA